MGTIIGAIASLLVGGTVAAVTVVGLVSGSVNSTSSNPADVNAPVVVYGSNN